MVEPKSQRGGRSTTWAALLLWPHSGSSLRLPAPLLPITEGWGTLAGAPPPHVCVGPLWGQPCLAQELVMGVWEGPRGKGQQAQAETPSKAQRVVVLFPSIGQKAPPELNTFQVPWREHRSAPACSMSSTGQASFGVLRLLCPSWGREGQPAPICWAKPSCSLCSGLLSSLVTPIAPPCLAHVLHTHLC